MKKMRILKSVQRRMLVMAFAVSCTVCPAQNWQALQGGLDFYTSKLYEDSVADKLYVGGAFTSVNNQVQWGIGSWNGFQWDSLGHGIDDPSIGNRPSNTHGMARYGNYLYVGGSFNLAGNLNTPAFARWDGASWSPVPGALQTDPNDEIRDIIVYNNELYVCGSFDSIGSTPANCIAKWDGTTWQAIGNNYQFTSPLIQFNLFKVRIYNGSLYVIGNFFDPSGNPCRMAKWDGANWIFFTTVFPGWGGLFDMEVYNNKLYVGGLFSIPGGKSGIMSWNDTTWSGVGGGTQIVSNPNPTVMDMYVHNNMLYCVGNFEKIGGIVANGLATWDGTSWCGYNTDFRNNNQSCGASNIAFYNDTMYLGGGFQTANGDSVYYIAKWIGGNYVDTCGVISTGIAESSFLMNTLTVFPNPASQTTTFQFVEAETREIKVYDQLGRGILKEETQGREFILSLETFVPGLYYFTVQSSTGQLSSGRFIVE